MKANMKHDIVTLSQYEDLLPVCLPAQLYHVNYSFTFNCKILKSKAPGIAARKTAINKFKKKFTLWIAKRCHAIPRNN